MYDPVSLAIVSAVTAVAGTGYGIYSNEHAKKDAGRAAEEQKQIAADQAAAESKYQTEMAAEKTRVAGLEAEAQGKYGIEMAAAKADAEKMQALNDKAELDRQANYEKTRAEQDAANTTALGERIKKAQSAASAKAGLKVGTGTALDLTKETDVLTKKDVDTIKLVGTEKSTALGMMGALGLQTAIESGGLYKTQASAEADLMKRKAAGEAGIITKSAAGEGELLKLKAKSTGQLADLRAKSITAEANRSSVGSLFGLANTLLGSYGDYKKGKQQNNNFYQQSSDSGYSLYA